MAHTFIGVGDPKAVKRYSVALAVDTAKESWWQSRMMSEGPEAMTPVQIITDLEADQGDTVTYDLSMQLRHEGVESDDMADGKEEGLQFYTDSLAIDQLRIPMGLGGRMTRKRTLIKLRETALARGKDWWARRFDELFFVYGSGARGVNTDFALKAGFTTFAGNALVAPDSQHLIYGGVATAKANLASTDKITIAGIRKVIAQAQTMGGGIEGLPQINPCRVEGEDTYVQVMHPWQAYDLKTAAATGEWLDVNKALTTAIGNKSPIFKGGIGMIDGVVLQLHKSCIRFSDYGAGANVAAARSLFMGRQALCIAYGNPGSRMRFQTVEETKDGGNKIVIYQGAIFGLKKTAFTIDGTSRDFGIIAMDTAAAKP